MNYIKHLTAVLELFGKDDRLNPTHISMYLALFQYWNISRFSESLSINRNEIMSLSKIGSKATYHKCIKDLDYWGYLKYLPSHNPFKGSKVILFNFCTSSEQALVHNSSFNEQALVRNSSLGEQALVSIQTYTNSKQKKEKQNIYINAEAVKNFFLKNKSTATEAEKFFNYNQSIGWKIGGKSPVEDWQSLALNWIIKAGEEKKEITFSSAVQKKYNPQVKTDKNYDDPL